jgi:hypothetical protein
MAEEIQIKIGVNASEANQTVGQLKTNLEGVDGAQKKVSNSTNQMNQSLKNTGSSIKNLGVEGVSRGIEKMAAGFSNLKLSNVAGGFRMVGAAIAANPIGAIATAVLALVSAFGGLEGIMSIVTGQFNSMAASKKAINETMDKSIVGYAKEKVELDKLFNSLNDVNIKGEKRNEIIKIVNEKYKDYLPNLLNEETKAKDLAAAYDAVNSSLMRKAITQAKTQALEEATSKLLKDQIDAQRSISKLQDLMNDPRATVNLIQNAQTQIKAFEKISENSRKTYQKELELIEKSSKDLAKTLGVNLDIPLPETPKPDTPQDDKKEETRQSKAVKTLAQKQAESLRIIQDRYNKEVKIITDANLNENNLLKEKLATGIIKQDEYDTEKLKLNVGLNNNLLNLATNFELSKVEKDKIGAENEKKLSQILNDDKLKLNGSYYDALIALTKSNDEKIKLQKEKEAEEERLRKEAELEEEKRQYEQSLSAFQNDFVLKKREIQLNDDLTEEERKIKLEEAELEFLRNKLSITALGNDEYFQLIQEITDKEIELNKNKNKKIEDDNKKRQEQLKAGFEAAVNVGNQALGAFSALADAQLAIRTKGLEKGSVEEQKAAKRDFETRKKISIASAVISGIEGIVNVWTAKSVLPIELATIYKGIQSAFIIATTAANIAKIKATTFQATSPASTDGGGGGGGDAPAAETPTFTPTSFFGLGQTTQFNPQEQGPTRVYVTEGDISNTQNRVRVVENRARFG